MECGRSFRFLGVICPDWHLLNNPSSHLLPRHHLFHPQLLRCLSSQLASEHQPPLAPAVVSFFLQQASLRPGCFQCHFFWALDHKGQRSSAPQVFLRGCEHVVGRLQTLLTIHQHCKAEEPLSKACSSLSCTWERCCLTIISSSLPVMPGCVWCAGSFLGTLIIAHLSCFPKTTCSILQSRHFPPLMYMIHLNV